MRLKLLVEEKTLKGSGLFIKLPEELAKQFPKLDKDTSPPHITLLFIGDITESEKETVAEITNKICEKYAPVEIFFGGLAYFSNPDAEVAHSIVEAQKLAAFRQEIWDALLQANIKIEDNHPHYTPHITLQYGDARDYKGEQPEGNFRADKIELWSDHGKVLDNFKLTGSI